MFFHTDSVKGKPRKLPSLSHDSVISIVHGKQLNSGWNGKGGGGEVECYNDRKARVDLYQKFMLRK